MELNTARALFKHLGRFIVKSFFQFEVLTSHDSLPQSLIHFSISLENLNSVLRHFTV